MSHPNTKSCTKCGVEKDRSEFYRNNARKDGIQGWCKGCEGAYRRSKPEKIKEYDAKYRKANPEKVRAGYEAYHKANRDKRNAQASVYRKANLEKGAALRAKYRAAKLQATPKWLNDRDFWLIEQFYEWSEYLDGPHHVDHIVPLRGKDVCGLHVPWNLQVLTAEENMKKSNKFEGGVYEQ